MANKRRNSGLSLIEVLIAMAIFVIGILAVLRIFPKSLGIITTNRDRAEAVRLAQARLEELRADEERLPDAILPAGLPTQTNPALGDFGFLRLGAGVDANRPYDFTAIAGANGWTDVNDPQALYRYLAASRLVVGERALVPRGTANGVEPTYTLMGPIDTAAGNLVEVFREFKDVDATDLRVTNTATGYQDRPVFAFMDGGIDSFTHQPAADRLLFELDARPRQLIVRYAYNDQGRPVWVQAPAGTTLLAATAGTPQSLYQEIVLTNANVIPGSVSVRQPLAHGGGSRFSFDDSAAGLGYVRVNTALAGEQVSLEYVARDWRLLHEEPMVVLAPAARAAEDPHRLLASEPFLRYDRNHWGGQLVDRYLRAAGIRPRERFEMDALDAIAAMVDRGLGVSLVPDWAPPWPEGLKIAKLALPLPGWVRSVGLFWVRMTPAERLVRALGEVAVAAMENLGRGEAPPQAVRST